MEGKKKADSLRKKAEGYINKKITLFHKDRFKDAIQLLRKASHLYGEVGMKFEAAQCIERAAECAQMDKDPKAEAELYIDTALLYEAHYAPLLSGKIFEQISNEDKRSLDLVSQSKSTNEEEVALTKSGVPAFKEKVFESVKGLIESQRCMEKACIIYAEKGQFSKAAKTKDKQALMNIQIENHEDVVKCYREAADFYEMNRAYPNVNAYLEKAAMYACHPMGDLKSSAKGFKELLFAKWNKNSEGEMILIKSQANKYLFLWVMCSLGSIDPELEDLKEKAYEIAQEMLDMDESVGFHFKKTREYVLSVTAIKSFSDRDLKLFVNQVAKMDKEIPFHEDILNVLLIVRKHLEKCVSTEPSLV